MPNSSPRKTSAPKTTDFYQVADAAGVPIVHTALPETRSMSIAIGSKGVIGLDNTHAMTHAEEQTRLGHELGHCLYGGFYARSTPYDVAERHEVRADRWYIRRAIPRDDLFRLLRQGYDAWEIAELLDTTEDYVRRAYYYYQSQDLST